MDKYNKIDTGRCIRRAMGFHEIRTDELADKMQISRQSVYLWKRSKDMSINRLAEIADEIGCDVHELIRMGEA